MKEDIQALERTLGEVLATRQRLDTLADQLRDCLAHARHAAREAERTEQEAKARAVAEKAAAEQAAVDRAEAERRNAERAAEAQRIQAQSDAARMELARLFVAQFEPFLKTGLKILQRQIERQDRDAEAAAGNGKARTSGKG